MDVIKLLCLLITVSVVASLLDEEPRSMSCNSAREGGVTTLNIKLQERYDRNFVLGLNNHRLIFICYDFIHCESPNQAKNSGFQFTWNVTEHPSFTENTESTIQPSFKDFRYISLNIFNTTRETVHGNWTLRSFMARTLRTHCTVYEIIKNLTCSKNISGRELEIECMASNIHYASKCTFHVNYNEPLYQKATKLNESEIWQGNEENILNTNDTYITRCSMRLRQLQVQGARYDIAVTMYPDGNNTVDYIQFGTTEMFSFKADVVVRNETMQEVRTSLTTEDGANLSVPVGVTFGVISLVLFIVAMAIIARKYKVGKKNKRIGGGKTNPLELQQDQNDCYDKTTFEVECVYQNIKEDDNESTYLNKVGGKLAASTNKNEELAREGTVEGGDNPYEEI